MAEPVAHFVRGERVVGDEVTAKCGRTFTIEKVDPDKLPVCRPCLLKHIEEGHGCRVPEWA